MLRRPPPQYSIKNVILLWFAISFAGFLIGNSWSILLQAYQVWLINGTEFLFVYAPYIFVFLISFLIAYIICVQIMQKLPEWFDKTFGVNTIRENWRIVLYGLIGCYMLWSVCGNISITRLL